MKRWNNEDSLSGEEVKAGAGAVKISNLYNATQNTRDLRDPASIPDSAHIGTDKDFEIVADKMSMDNRTTKRFRSSSHNLDAVSAGNHDDSVTGHDDEFLWGHND